MMQHHPNHHLQCTSLSLSSPLAHLAGGHGVRAGVEENTSALRALEVSELGAVGPLETGGLEEDCYYFYHYHYLETCCPEGDHYAALC